MKISRAWTTPLTIGAFMLMAVTGMLMFFHLETNLNKLAHEWLGWLMIAGGITHALANWTAFKHHFLHNPTGRGILLLSALVVALSFAPMPNGGAGKHVPPPVLALNAITHASLAALAPLSGKSVEQLMVMLNQAGLAASSPNDTLAQLTAGERQLIGKALRVIFATP